MSLSLSLSVLISSFTFKGCCDYVRLAQIIYSNLILGFPGISDRKESACQYRKCRRHGLDPWVRKISWRRKWQLILVFLFEKAQEQRNLVGYSPWGLKESDTIEQLRESVLSQNTHTHTHTHTHTQSLYFILHRLAPLFHVHTEFPFVLWHIHRFWSLKLGHSRDHHSVHHPPLLPHYLTHSPISILNPAVCFIVFLIT